MVGARGQPPRTGPLTNAQVERRAQLKNVKRRWLTLCLVMHGGVPHCAGDIEYVVHEFGLSPCPDTGFALPQVVDGPSYRISAVSERHSPAVGRQCGGFRVYELRETQPGGVNIKFDVRLIPQESCKLYVAYAYNTAGASAEELRRWAETLAQRLVHGASPTRSVHETTTSRFDSWQDLRPWCAAAVVPQRDALVSPRQLAGFHSSQTNCPGHSARDRMSSALGRVGSLLLLDVPSSAG